MNRVTGQSVLKNLVVATVAVIGLQGVALAAVSQQSVPVKSVKSVDVQAVTKADSKKAAPLQVAGRLSGGLRINTACDDTGLPCPSRP